MFPIFFFEQEMENPDASPEELLTGAEQLEHMTSGNATNLEKCKDQLDEYNSLEQTLSQLLKKAKHNVLVPVGGGVGYFEGQLVHTNDVLVLLGDNWWANRSVFQAVEIVNRRLQFLSREQKVLQEERRRLEAQQQVFTQTTGHAVVAAKEVAQKVACSNASATDQNEEDNEDVVLDPEDDLSEDELQKLEEELADQLDNEEFVEKILLERMLEKRAKRLSAPPSKTSNPSFSSPSDIGRSAQPSAVRVAAGGIVGDVVERTATIPMEAKTKKESLFRKSLS